jgi:hypothetical protein
MFLNLPTALPQDPAQLDEPKVTIANKSMMSLFCPPVLIGTTNIGSTDLSANSTTIFGSGKALDGVPLVISGSGGSVTLNLTGSSNAASLSALTASINTSGLTASYVTASIQYGSSSQQYLKLFTPSGSLSVTANVASNTLGLMSSSVKSTTTFVEAAIGAQKLYVFDNLADSSVWSMGGAAQPGTKDPHSTYSAFSQGIYTANGGILIYDTAWATAMTASIGPGYFFAPIFAVYNNSTVTDGLFLS